MRMRKKKNGAARLEKCQELLAKPCETPIESSMYDFGCEAPLWLEIGAGKGGFARAMSARHPEICYYALERSADCIVLAAEALAAERAADPTRPDNLRYLIDSADRLRERFAAGSVSRIFLNFSDPWSKKGYYKRRLTYRGYLAVYLELLADGGELHFKTDNVGLFDFTLEELAAMGLTPVALTRDLHASEYNEGNVRTEYEERFSALGYPIHYLSIRKG